MHFFVAGVQGHVICKSANPWNIIHGMEKDLLDLFTLCKVDIISWWKMDNAPRAEILIFTYSSLNVLQSIGNLFWVLHWNIATRTS